MINAHYLFLLLIVFVFMAYEATQSNGEIYVTEMFDPSDRKQSDYWTDYQISLKRNCNPDEVDTGDHCVTLGCETGMERGVGAGTDRCYPPCLNGYENNGMSRCYQACPPGYETKKTQCIRPKHSYQKDVQPCRNCNSLLPNNQVVTDSLIDEMKSFHKMNPNLMPPTPQTYAMGLNQGMYQQPIMQIATPVYPIQRTIITNNPFRGNLAKISTTNGGGGTVAGGILQEGFDGNVQGEFPTRPPNNNDNGNSPMLPDSKTANTSMTVQQSAEGSAMPSASSGGGGVVQEPNPNNSATVMNLIEPTARGPHGMCPLGYSLSGNMCYENCPPQYRDEGDKCSRDTYVTDRSSYDRGGGVPYKRIRSKHSNAYSY